MPRRRADERAGTARPPWRRCTARESPSASLLLRWSDSSAQSGGSIRAGIELSDFSCARRTSDKSLARELRIKQKWTDRQFAMMCVQHGTWLPCCRLPRLTHKLATMELYDMMRLKLTETRVPTPLPFFTTRFPPLSVSLIALPPLSLQHVVASSHLARGISCSLWWISQTSSSCSWSCPGKSVFWNRRIGHDLNQHAGRPLHVWTLYMTGVTSTRRAPSRCGIRCLLGAVPS